jgi:serine/threonine-protein kinase RsbW
MVLRLCGPDIRESGLPLRDMIAAKSSTNSSLVISNKISEMTRVVALVEQFGAAHNIPNKVINELNLCLDEILNNTISYGYEDSDSHDICVTLMLADGVVSAEIVDDGKPFDPRQSIPPDPSQGLRERKLGGVGLHFVQALMDKVEYLRKEGCNHLKLHKKLQV